MRASNWGVGDLLLSTQMNRDEKTRVDPGSDRGVEHSFSAGEWHRASSGRLKT